MNWSARTVLLTADILVVKNFLSNCSIKAVAIDIPVARTFLSNMYLVIFIFLIAKIVMQGQQLC